MKTIPDNDSLKQTAILIHGCHLHTIEWGTIVFGIQDRLGRVPRGIEEAVNRRAALIFWGAGTKYPEVGKRESEYIYDQSLGPKFTQITAQLKTDPDKLLEYLKRVSVLGLESKNTAEEIKEAVEECRARGIKKLYLVSSPTHIARCFQEACKYQEKNPTSIKFYAAASDTCFANSTAADVTVVEPPHRGDMPLVPFHQTVPRIFQFLRSPDIAFAFNNAFANLIEEYKRKQQEEDQKAFGA